MKREHVAFLFGGFAFGILVGYGLFHAIDSAPDLDAAAQASASVPTTQGPMAPTQVGAGGAPMVARVNELKRVLQQDADNLEALVELGDLYFEAAMWDRAIGYYERAVQIEPDDPDLLTDLGMCYRGIQRFDRALELFEQAHQQDSAHWRSLFNTVVVAAFDTRRLEVALEAMKAIEAIDPRPAELNPARVQQLRDALERAIAAEQGEEQS